MLLAAPVAGLPAWSPSPPPSCPVSKAAPAGGMFGIRGAPPPSGFDDAEFDRGCASMTVARKAEETNQQTNDKRSDDQRITGSARPGDASMLYSGPFDSDSVAARKAVARISRPARK